MSEIGLGLVGYRFMGRAHSNAYRQAARFFDVDRAPRMRVLWWWPPGHTIGYEHTFVHTVKDLLDGIKKGKNPGPTFEDGFRVQAVIDAVERSLESRGWTEPETDETHSKGGAYGEE